MNKKDELLVTAWKIEHSFKETGYDSIKAYMMDTPHKYIAVRNQGILIMEISKEEDWVIDLLYPITKSFLEKITKNLI